MIVFPDNRMAPKNDLQELASQIRAWDISEIQEGFLES